ncbi:MAG: DUF5683 domain-containing protein [Candidatus Kapaibacterium sp.]
MRRFACIILMLTLPVSARQVCAQSASTDHPDTVRAPVDSTFHMTKSPLEAVLLSAALPGAGQVYLHQAWKVPIIYALAGGFFYAALLQNSRYFAAIDSVNNRFARHTSVDTFYALAWGNSREFYRNDRDKWWIYLGLAYIANILDAYVSANLYDFDVSTPGSSPIESYYDPIDRRVEVSYTLHF